MARSYGGVAPRHFVAWVLISVFYAFQYIFRVMPNTFSGLVMEKFGVGAFAFGQFSALYYVGYTSGLIPLGMLLDRWGLSRVTPFCVALTVLGIVPMMFGPWYLVQFGRVITGFGSAGAALSIFKISSMHFGKKYAVMTSIALTIGLFGAMYGGAPVRSIAEYYGWDVFISMLVGVGIVLAVLCSVVLSYARDTSPQSRSFLELIKLALFNRKLLTVSILGGCMIGSMEGFADGWATAFLTEVCHIDSDRAAFLPSAIFLSSGIGSLALSWLLSKSFDGVGMIICCGALTVLSFIMLLTGTCGSVYGSFVLLVIIGFVSGYRLLTICKAIEYVGPAAVASATAVSNMIIMLFGCFFHTIIASVIHAHWDGIIINGHAEYGAGLLVKALAVVPLGALVGTIGFLIFRIVENKNVQA